MSIDKKRTAAPKPKAKPKAKPTDPMPEFDTRYHEPMPKSELEPEPEPEDEECQTCIDNLSITSENSESSGKSLGNTDQSACRDNVKDVVIFGDDLFKLLSKASSQSEGWMKSTKAMHVTRGCVVQVTTQQRNPDGSYSVAEALSFVPGVRIAETLDENGVVTGRKLK